jgi:hypothetical protein
MTVADEVCSMDEATLLYPQLGLLANLGLVGSGRLIRAVHAAVGPGGMGAVLQVGGQHVHAFQGLVDISMVAV